MIHPEHGEQSATNWMGPIRRTGAALMLSGAALGIGAGAAQAETHDTLTAVQYEAAPEVATIQNDGGEGGFVGSVIDGTVGAVSWAGDQLIDDQKDATVSSVLNTGLVLGTVAGASVLAGSNLLEKHREKTTKAAVYVVGGVALYYGVYKELYPNSVLNDGPGGIVVLGTIAALAVAKGVQNRKTH